MLVINNTRLLVVTLLVCADINSFSTGPRISECELLFRYSDRLFALILRRVNRFTRIIGDTSAAIKLGPQVCRRAESDREVEYGDTG